jgi:hypothetical protein
MIISNCSIQEQTIKGVGNPEISNYIRWSSRILSIRTMEDIEPIFEIILRKNTNDIITEFEFDVIYLYGQEFHFQDKSSFFWGKNSPELIELNSSGFITIRKELVPIKREILTKKEDIFTFTGPDGENLQGIFKKISFRTQK